MKLIFILILAIFVSSCCGIKKSIQTQSEPSTEVAVIESPEVDHIPRIIKSKDSLTTISKGEFLIAIKDSTKIDNSEAIGTTERINDTIYFIEIAKHDEWDKLLKKHVSESGKVDYESFKNDQRVLNNYINSLTATLPNDKWSKESKLAYWINAYNALTIDLIIRNYPLESIKDIKDPWDQRLWKFGDKWQNLNDIEHKILRKMNEPRIHFAIVCASESCPKLQNSAFTSENLEDQLTNATKEFLADTSKNELSKNSIKLSKIFKWFKKDFEQDGSLIDFINEYSEVTISDKAKKSFKDYDWNLND